MQFFLFDLIRFIPCIDWGMFPIPTYCEENRFVFFRWGLGQFRLPVFDVYWPKYFDNSPPTTGTVSVFQGGDANLTVTHDGFIEKDSGEHQRLCSC